MRLEFIKKLAERNENADGSRPLLVAFLGDSVTHGCFECFMNNKGEIDTVYDPEQGFVALFQRELRWLYPRAAVNTLNAGISGQRSKDGLRRLDRDVLERNPDLVVVNFGGNDCTDVPSCLESYERNMTEIFSRIRAKGIEALLLTPHALCRYVSPFLTDPELRKIAADIAQRQNDGTFESFIAAAKRAAAATDVPVADCYAIWQRLHNEGVDTTTLLSNHINHPTPAANRFYVQALFKALYE